MNGYLKAGDIISGQEGEATATIRRADGTVSNENLFFARTVTGTVSINKTAVKTLGKRGEQHKTIGWSGSGSMNIFYVSSLFRRMAMQYIKTGVPVYFDLLVTNRDPASGVGQQVTSFKSCTLNSIIMGKLDTESDTLDEDVEFTFDDVDLLEDFQDPVLGQL